jgi:Sec-independent protein translocase protein TatA
MIQLDGMFALSRGEFLLAAFIFALVWGAGALPRFGQRLGARLAARRDRDGG